MKKTWRCDACGEAENCDVSCTVIVNVGKPEFCPITGDETEWYNPNSKDRLKQIAAIDALYEKEMADGKSNETS